MIRAVVAILLMCGVCYGIWWGWDQITLLRGTVWWEYRYVVLLVAGVIAFSLAEFIASRVPAKDATHDD